MRSGRRIGNCH
ncbi:hypothetical protein LINPERPRIM_LOCUS17636 [Linum perenne]